jgi:K(+)-stimulated pyrophosphate-energized sodium pump
MSVVALVIAPSIALSTDALTEYASNENVIEKVEMTKKVKVDMTKNDDGTVKAVVTTAITKNGETTTAFETFTGTEAEVKAKLDALKDVEVTIENDEKMIEKVEEEIVK